jgi:dipeptide/tripeptide permease
MVSIWQSAVRTTRPPRRTLPGLNLALVALSIGLLAFPASIFAKEEPTVNISVLVYNYARAAPGTLAGAEHQADRILNQAGVRAVWFDCPVKPAQLDEKSICRSELGNQNIVLRLLSRRIPTRVPDFVFGFAVSPGLASVYYRDAALLAEQQEFRSDLPTLLGCFMVHEIGHLFLNPYGHSPTGIMQAKWGPQQLQQSLTGLMTFTPAQSRLIREQVQTRMSLSQDGRTAETSSR